MQNKATLAVQIISLLMLAATWISFDLLSIKNDEEGPGQIKHAIFIAGPDFTGILDENEKEVWRAPRSGARDGYILPNSHALICWADEIIEFDKEKNIIFRYQIDTLINQELGTAQRLANGNTLVAELGIKPRLIEVTNSGQVEIEVALQPETTNIHMQTRMARKIDNGNYLVPHLLAFAVKEYSPAGEIIRIIRTDLDQIGGRIAENWPFTAIRLPDEHVLITLTHGNKAIEVDSDGEIVWSITNEDLPGSPIDDACGAQRLANGNTVIASYHAQKGVKLLEVTRAKELVWTYRGPHRIHHFQILTTNGITLKGPVLK